MKLEDIALPILFEGGLDKINFSSDPKMLDREGWQQVQYKNKPHAFNLTASYARKQSQYGLIRLHASDIYERRVIKTIVDALVQSGSFKLKRWYHSDGGKTFELKRVRT